MPDCTKEHLNHMKSGNVSNDCILCNYRIGMDAHAYEEGQKFCDAALVATTTIGEKLLKGLKGNNNNRIIDEEMFCFTNYYYEFATVRWVTTSEINNTNKIARFNKTEIFIPPELKNLTSDPDYWPKLKKMIKAYMEMYNCTEDIMRVLLGTFGLGITPRRKYDNYSEITFIDGPCGRGKTELHKIIRLMVGEEMCITVCHNTFGQRFSTAQYANSIAKFFLPDELPGKKDKNGNKVTKLSKTQLFNYIDQTKQGAEKKNVQDLEGVEFRQQIIWVANGFWDSGPGSDWEKCDATARRFLYIMLEYVAFKKMENPPAIQVQLQGEVRLLNYMFF